VKYYNDNKKSKYCQKNIAKIQDHIITMIKEGKDLTEYESIVDLDQIKKDIKF